MNHTRLVALCIVLLLYGVSVAQTPLTNTNAQTGSTPADNTNNASSGKAIASSEQTSKLEARLNRYFTDYRNTQWRYSWAYHICIYGAAILSALAALLSKVHVKSLGLEDPTRRDNWTASLAAIAALLIAISTAGKFQDSWQTNRVKRYAVESLLNQLASDQNLTLDELEAYGKRLSLVIDPSTSVDPKTVSPKN